MTNVALFFALAAPLTVLACDGPDRRDAERIVSLVGRIRSVEGSMTPTALAELKAAPCNLIEVCRTRDACLVSLEATSKALTLKSEVEIGVTAMELGKLQRESPEAKELAKKLDEASRLLDEGHERLPACDESLQGLHRRFRI